MTRRRFVDGRGVAFAEYRDLLPASVHDFPKIQVVKHRRLLKELHAEWQECAVCRWTAGSWNAAACMESLQIHHIAHGALGRSDERTNLLALCSRGPDAGCHAEAHGGRLSLGRLLFCKWATDRHGVSWVRLSVLLGRFLPELETGR